MTIYLSLPGWFQLSPVFINIMSLLSLSRMSWYIEINHDPSHTVQHNSLLCVGTYICHRVCSFWCKVCLIRAVNFILKELNPPQTLIPVAVIHTHKHTSRHAHCTLYKYSSGFGNFNLAWAESEFPEFFPSLAFDFGSQSIWTSLLFIAIWLCACTHARLINTWEL